MKTKPWNLEECKADPEHKCIVVDKNGVIYHGRVISFDVKNAKSIVVVYEKQTDKEKVFCFTAGGEAHWLRLLLPVKECGGWFNHYDDGEVSGPYESEHAAADNAACNYKAKQIHHTWEE